MIVYIIQWRDPETRTWKIWDNVRKYDTRTEAIARVKLVRSIYPDTRVRANKVDESNDMEDEDFARHANYNWEETDVSF